MERRRENNTGWMSVPQFGAWDKKGGSSPNYSMVFGQARENRKQAKRDVKHLSLGNEADLMSRHAHHHAQHHHHPHPHNRSQDDSLTRKKTLMTYVNCCIRPY
ncbi:hypothetical protein RND81_12G176000 [Saponaria officinalis]|uniref:RIN4 pathogenic type III effector avirulence factor Avr cleavage site domain-containing protein n=1 Tax=Saponaria officinalis TaxID=3572 RepID=A0AAW1HBZ2_SAPOF